ncbi:hypothetical protein AN641_09900 [Candidatus Epulonipiscioides gigas]|nr:hypothetical protein AN641_09900 [Epulopiscium sp. SCG-C07WGA-EpuloA2]
MSNKAIIKTVVTTLATTVLLLFFVYDFSFTLINIADALFIVGLFLFFPALIIITEATKVFDGFTYVRHKFSKSNSFKTIYDYKEYKLQKNLYKKNIGKPLMIIALCYIGASLIVSHLLSLL